MNKDISFEIHPVSNICDASGCFSNATEVLKVQVGDLGKIPLSLCKRCKLKFDPIPINHTISSEEWGGK